MKDYKAISLSYQPCNRPLSTEKGPKKKRQKQRPSKRLRKFAEAMRIDMTPAETIMDAVLTEMLPRYSLTHKSQHIVGRYILDFAIPKHRLGIEVDGIYHFFRGRKDGFRTQQLKRKGWRIIRFTNHAVETDIVAVAAEILAACGSQYSLAE